LEDDGAAIGSCVTAAGLALVDGGFPINGVPIGCSLVRLDI